MIVGTSTNCSTINGSDRAAREGQEDDEEILGTAMTCSSTGRSRARKNSSTLSTICGTGASRICTDGKSSMSCFPECRAPCTCQPATSDRGAGRPPGGGGFCRRGASYVSPSTPSLPLLCVVVVVVVVCVCAVWRVRCGTLKPPYVDSKHPRVHIQNVPV